MKIVRSLKNCEVLIKNSNASITLASQAFDVARPARYSGRGFNTWSGHISFS